MSSEIKKRCFWVSDDPLYIDYHDNEWGKPEYDSQKLFEFLVLEGMQAGLSWITILKRRENYYHAFDQLNPQKIALYDQKKINELLENKGIIRNRLKIKSIIKNAQSYLKLQEKESFSQFIWQFVDGKPKINHFRTKNEIPTETDASRKLSKALKARGFSFVGPTICYAFMQACGLVNDHTTDCFLYPKKSCYD
jgi:DNA-3-methyladenine glycosylase I